MYLYVPICHHQVAHSSCNLNVVTKKLIPTINKKTLDLVNWEKFFDRKDINAQVTSHT